MAQQTGHWNHGLFECFSPLNTCCLSFWCPCILYGKTQARKEGNPDASLCNGSCMGWAALAMFLNPFQGVLQMSSRGSMRRQYGIESNGCNDCMISCCCGCCALIQEDKEVTAQEEKGWKLPTTQQPMGYEQPATQMMYQPPQQPGTGLKPGEKQGYPAN